MFCTECGTELPEGSQFCPNCGAHITQAGASAPGTAGDAAFQPQTPEPERAATAQLPVIDPVPPAQGDPAPAQVTAQAAPPTGASARKGLATGAKAGIVLGAIAVVLVIVVAIGLLAPKPATSVTVSFETDGGSTISAQTVEPGDTITSPSNPEKEGYAFEGWYSDAGLTQKVGFPYIATDDDATLYAKWTKISEGDTQTQAGSTSKTYSDSSTSLNALKAYFSDMKKMSSKIATGAKHFNAKFKKGASSRDEVRIELEDLEADIYNDLADGYETAWKVTSMDVPSQYASVRDKMGTASDRLLDRIHAMTWALDAIDSMYDPTSSQIDTAIASYMQDSHRSYEQYKKLEKSISNALG